MNTELIREVKEIIYKKLESFIGTELDNTDEYRKYRKIVLEEWEKHPELFENRDDTELMYNLTFTTSEGRMIDDITISFKSPECIADYKEIE